LNIGADILGGMASGNLAQRHNSEALNVNVSLPPIGTLPMPAVVVGYDTRDPDRVVELQVGGGYGAGVSITGSRTRTYSIYRNFVLPLRRAMTDGLCASTGRC
jgi:hypothetical protein